MSKFRAIRCSTKSKCLLSIERLGLTRRSITWQATPCHGSKVGSRSIATSARTGTTEARHSHTGSLNLQLSTTEQITANLGPACGVGPNLDIHGEEGSPKGRCKNKGMRAGGKKAAAQERSTSSIPLPGKRARQEERYQPRFQLFRLLIKERVSIPLLADPPENTDPSTHRDENSCPLTSCSHAVPSHCEPFCTWIRPAWSSFRKTSMCARRGGG
jgi:hypothetical protein